MAFFFSKKFRYKEINEHQFLNPIVGCCQGKIRAGKSGVTVRLLKSFWFSRNCVFYDFFHFFDQKPDIKKNNRTSISQRYRGVLSGYIQGFKIWSPSIIAQIFLVLEKWCFYDFFNYFFFKNLRYKKTNRTSISQPYSEVVSGYIQWLQIWRPSMTVQIFLAFEKIAFFMIFSFFFKKI